MPVREESSPDETETERFSLPGAKQRWLELLSLEHATLPLPLDFAQDGDQLVVRRVPVRGRRISAGRIPRDYGAPLFLQAAAMASFLQASALWLDEEDLRDAAWGVEDRTPRLWLARTPSAVQRGGPGPASCAVLAAFLDRLFARGRRISHPAARGLFERMLSSDAGHRRAEFWLASALRAFPQLASPLSAGARARTLGSAGGFLRSAASRALAAKARALLANRAPRVFPPDRSGLTPGGALGLEKMPDSVAQAARALRERHARESGGRRAVWIAVEPERWDALSRRAFETASGALGDEVETAMVSGTLPPPLLPDDWRREIFVPCGTLNASLRFYEAFAGVVQEDPSGAWRLADAIVRSSEWAAFAADATGDAPLPLPPAVPAAPVERTCTALERELLEALSVAGKSVRAEELSRLLPRRNLRGSLARLERRGELERKPGNRWRLSSRARGGIRLSPSRREEMCRRWARIEEDPGRRVELWLAGGETEEALAEAQRWFRACPPGPAELWFGLSALLAPAAGETPPVWLEALEADRELAGGRPEEAEKRLARIADSPRAAHDEVRAAKLRLAEVSARLGRTKEAGLQASAWRRAFPQAPAPERLRALLLEARSRAREGEHEAALTLLDEADRAAAEFSTAERVEAALARADVYCLAGRFREEKETYDRWRPLVLQAQDDRLTARLLSHEALGLTDRGEFAQAIARLGEALSATRDDTVERARLSIDLASTLYEAGREGRCRELLDQAAALGGAAGRDDLARIARTNRLELLIRGGEWDAASREVETLLESARKESDATRILAALHHRSRLGLRRGLLAEAARDNREARVLAEKLGEKHEVGELWLEEGDRLLYEGDLEAARRAYESAAAAHLDRRHSRAKARQRLDEIAWAGTDGPPDSDRAALEALFKRDEYAAAETAARWQVLLRGKGEVPPDVRSRADQVLRARGGAALAERVFGGVEASLPPWAGAPPPELLRQLRAAVAGALAGKEGEAPLAALGLAGLAVRDGSGREVVAFGAVAEGADRRQLHGGTASYELSLWPPIAGEAAQAIAFLIETLLFRLAPAEPPSDFAEGWRRLGVTAGDASMEEPYRRLVRFAPQPVTVLVLGESGSGKEAVARAVHALSPRASGPFVPVNVSAIPPALLESELFGHARGAFTGADRDREGLLEEAGRGTIFFDEIGDLTLPLQAKLLRALQEREIRRVGENRPRRLDVRVVSATARNLEREVEAGRFREDLYYRLHVAVITLPALRDRGRDTQLLARRFLWRYAREYGRGDLTFAPETLTALSAHSWPGNVRELQNVVAQAAALAESGGAVAPELLPEPLRRGKRAAASRESYRARVDQHRRGLITEALERAGGNRSRAARDLGLSRQALLYLIRELSVPSRPRGDH